MCDALEQADHQVRLLLANRTSQATKTHDGVEFLPCDSFREKLRFNLSVLQAITTTQADVVVLHQEFQVPVAIVAAAIMRCFRRPVPVVVDIRTLPVHASRSIAQRIRWLRFRLSVKMASSLLAGVTAITPAMTDFLVEKNWLHEKSVLGHWSSGVAPELAYAPLPPEMAQVLASLPRPVGVYLGVLAENRGLDKLIQAAECPGFCGSLVIVGSGPIESHLRLMRGANRRNVLLTGRLPQEQAWSVLSRCDYGICLLPDLLWWRVSSPLKILEYLAAGLPILASSPVHDSLLGDYEGALLVPDSEPTTICEATGRMLAVRPDDAQRKAILKRYSWRMIAEDCAAALEKARG
jgi:glycosyltransferase involved in cell wall biosynthesis